MYIDVQMYTTSAAIDPQAHMRRWTTKAAHVSQKDGKWSGGNDGRHVNPEYNRLWEAARTESGEHRSLAAQRQRFQGRWAAVMAEMAAA